jgi:hypothetical protein
MLTCPSRAPSFRAAAPAPQYHGQRLLSQSASLTACWRPRHCQSIYAQPSWGGVAAMLVAGNNALLLLAPAGPTSISILPSACARLLGDNERLKDELRMSVARASAMDEAERKKQDEFPKTDPATSTSRGCRSRTRNPCSLCLLRTVPRRHEKLRSQTVTALDLSTYVRRGAPRTGCVSFSSMTASWRYRCNVVA